MCGIAGFLQLEPAPDDGALPRLAAMLAALQHRGPDDQGSWQDGPIVLGHRRLAIVDLSPAGHQPMPSSSGRYMLAFNGEIYNHAALRAELATEGVAFRGHADTEVLLALIDRDGLLPALRRCIGMFAIALWDRDQRTLQLARDRIGEKPLYWSRGRQSLLFASELKALRAHPDGPRGTDPEAVAALLRLGYIPAPLSIHPGVRQVEPGTVVTVSVDGRSTCTPWWSMAEVLQAGLAQPMAGRFEDASVALEALLADAVGLQMQADVPLGAFLSGGVDSSLVVALMQRQSRHRVRSFAIGFDEPGMNEAPHAAAVAAHLGTDHTELLVTSAQALAVIPSLPTLYDEPLGDSSQIPTYLVSRLARSQVTVSLSGDGGDELFGGYTKYRHGQRLAAQGGRRLLAGALGLLPLGRLEQAERHWSRGRLHSPRAASLRHWLGAPDHATLAARLGEVNREAHRLQAGGPAAHAAASVAPTLNPPHGYAREAMAQDILHYLPDDVLTKVDRASMAVSLESRAPLLDHRIAEFAARLPESWLFDARGGKRILRDVLYRCVPPALVDRPKQGFSVPLARWLRGELRGWAADLLQHSPHTADVINLPHARALLADHLGGRRDNAAQLWPALSLLAWLHHGAVAP